MLHFLKCPLLFALVFKAYKDPERKKHASINNRFIKKEVELIKAGGPQRALRNHTAIGASKCENRPGNYFKRTNCVICSKACAEMCTGGIKSSLLCVIFTGPRICDLPVRAAPKTREPRSRRQQLPRVLHAAPSTVAGGLAGAPRSHAHL